MESGETPKKLYYRQEEKRSSSISVCRLCGNEAETRHLLRVFSKSGIAKELATKVLTTCGVRIEETGSVICRKCEAFVDKMNNFLPHCKQVESNFAQQKPSVKRCPEISPSSKQPNEKQTKPNNKPATAKKLFSSSSSVDVTSSLTCGSEMTINIGNNESVNTTDKFVSIHYTPILPSHTRSEAVQSFKSEMQSIYLSDAQQQKIVRAANTKQASAVAHIIKQHCPNVLSELKRSIINDIKSSCHSLCKRSKGTCLYGNNYDSMSEMDFDKIWEEIKSTCPFLIDIFNAVSGAKEPEPQVKYSFIYSILMNVRWHELSVVQRVNTVLMIEGGCTKQLQQRLNKLGVCLSHARRDILLKLMGGQFLDKTIQKVKGGVTFRGTGDNWDLKILKGHMRKEVQNDDLHLFASNLIGNRLSFNHLPNDHPKGDIRHFSRQNFVLNNNEWKHYAQCAKVIVGRIVLEFFPKFNFLKTVIPDHIPHDYSVEMSQKSHISSLPIINANESSYADCVLILRTYERWIAEIYCEAGLLPQIPHVHNPPLPGNAAAPGQTYAHMEDTPNDEMKEMKIPFAGDQLTRVRFAGAKDLLAGSHTPSDRFEHCSPFKPVMWHTRASLLQYSYSLLHKADSVNQVGTLKYFREKFNRKNATPSKVLNSFEGSEELFLSMGRAYILVAAMKFFGMATMEDRPTLNKFPNNINHASLQNKKEYFDDTFDKLIGKFLSLKDDEHHPPMVDDHIRNYATCCIFLTLLILQMKDTAREADGERNLVNQKMLLLVFKSLGAYSKYAIEMFVSIAQIECLLTSRLSEQFKWGFFVNWRGGAGKNLEDDLAQEISNRISKGIVQRMGANKTIQSISKICKAVSGIKEITEKFDGSLGIHKRSVQHTTREALTDEKEMVADLLRLQPFEYQGRAHASFPDIRRCPLNYLVIGEFHIWLEKHKKKLYN